MAYGQPRNSALGLTFRSSPSGRLTGTTQRVMKGLSSNFDARGNYHGSTHSSGLPGLNFHTNKAGKTVASSEYVPGIGTFTRNIRTGKQTSFTNTEGFRSAPNGKSKGSSRSY